MIEKILACVNEQITTDGFVADSVVNIDETNIEFDMTGSVTLEKSKIKDCLTFIIRTICKVYSFVGCNFVRS